MLVATALRQRLVDGSSRRGQSMRALAAMLAMALQLSTHIHASVRCRSSSLAAAVGVARHELPPP